MSSIRCVERGDTSGEGHSTPNSMPYSLLLWNVEHHMFTYNKFVGSGEFVIETHRSFRHHFRIGHHGEISSHNTIVSWVSASTFKGSVIKTKLASLSPTAYTLQNVDRGGAVQSWPFC